MSFKPKNLFFVEVFAFFLISIFPLSSWAKRDGRTQLNSFTGSSLSVAGIGAASNGDQTMSDINPALISALNKQYTAFGNFNFNSGFTMFEAGVLDSNSDVIGAVFKVRQTTPQTTEYDRRYTLGLSGRLGKLPVSLGIMGNYDQYAFEGFSKSDDTNFSGNIGLLGQLDVNWDEPIFIGLSVTKLFDKYENTNYNLALSKNFAQGLLNTHIDFLSDLGKENETLGGGIDIKARTYFYIRFSAGRNFAGKRNYVGSGIFFDGPNLKANFALAKNHTRDEVIEYSVGLSIAF